MTQQIYMLNRVNQEARTGLASTLTSEGFNYFQYDKVLGKIRQHVNPKYSADCVDLAEVDIRTGRIKVNTDSTRGKCLAKVLEKIEGITNLSQ